MTFSKNIESNNSAGPDFNFILFLNSQKHLILLCILYSA